MMCCHICLFCCVVIDVFHISAFQLFRVLGRHQLIPPFRIEPIKNATTQTFTSTNF